MEVKRLAIKTNITAFTHTSNNILSSNKDVIYSYKSQVRGNFSKGRKSTFFHQVIDTKPEDFPPYVDCAVNFSFLCLNKKKNPPDLISTNNKT